MRFIKSADYLPVRRADGKEVESEGVAPGFIHSVAHVSFGEDLHAN